MKTNKDWDDFYLQLCEVIAQQSYAEDKKVGAIIVKGDNIIAFSYNGTPRKTNNDTQKCTVLHAEAQAIAKVARSNLSTENTTLYCTLSPCLDCSKLIYSCGITRVVYRDKYKCTKGVEFLQQNGVFVNEQANHVTLIDLEFLKKTGLL
jgi:dCMP deaminase